jgi:uncharacterized protein YbjT (DUF2867 family)
MTILVTGGTGALGTPTVALLKDAGHDIRVLSRKPGPYMGDLTSGAGLAEAFAGVDTVLHLATSAGSKDTAQTRNAVNAARAAGVSHFIYISIVGVDAVPYPYYKSKLASERIIESSDLPFTILRATQFHSFIAMFIKLQRRLPVILAVDVPDQPIAVEEVAVRLVELVKAGPSGRVADIGGPEHLRLLDAIATWQTAAGTHKPVWILRFFGKTIRAFKAGKHMTALPGFGRETFAEYAANAAPAREAAK